MKMQDDDLLRALQDKEEASAKYVWGELATTREQSRRGSECISVVCHVHISSTATH